MVSGLFVDFELMDFWAVWNFEGIVGNVGTDQDEMTRMFFAVVIGIQCRPILTDSSHIFFGCGCIEVGRLPLITKICALG